MPDLDTRCELTDLPAAMCDHCRTAVQHVPTPAASAPTGLGWRIHAACRDTDPDLFFRPSATSVALRVCAGCTVREACLLDALQVDDPFGVRGGLDPAGRRRLEVRDGRIVKRPVIKGRRCQQCGGPVRPSPANNAKYCSGQCRRRASFERASAHV